MALPEIVIQPRRSLFSLNLQEIWQYRELFLTLAWRDIKVRYKQTVLGVIWAVVQPVLSTVIFTVFFGRLAGIPSGQLPYSLFVLIGLVFWNFFSGSLISISNSLVENEHIIKKVYFPRIVLPLSAVVTSCVDFFINLLILFAYAFYLGYPPHTSLIIILPLAFFTTILAAAGSGLFFSALNVKYRDVRYALPYFFQLLMFLTPVIYSLNIISGRNSLIMAVNPMTSVIESVRMSFSSDGSLNPGLLIISALSVLGTLLVGLWYFNRTESQFADIA
ncbi:hypothetical protein A3H89_05240 [Candidatus Amesbacteria bacterium RIFCSPLOWO2_02_FULL_48_11]|uniref:Transport permease protein n=5 Tax=Candidatus Amesiibacteriota TaxID=1752730 RepID=A0A1F4ZGK6_9BACT|nr:MAG: ABC-2 type transporter [Candidatus Amesbacteria bacterium GW2011_GWA2_47_11]KKU92603.1 MAG: ABC-2 type transporter [Candidatus Amesbacteria bacterium GW2011_GWC1_48_10]KKW01141.1 MAG: ABC-2 type transporter [Candidatus Amesbacteria bacterium GW2011_GWA1_48_9]OGC90508.1 MAG: hypothetical protein A2V48_00410 [Candidatus Amesbacteria bacterium RBG_19FT_COMBO_48_16]OGC95436.1 MAG: hypothetical protein A3C34_03340 [Candidatus Amesbacteria bacterium RIFCSPHIGHO2_02_FULL_48_21]OGC98876.1 MAG: